MGVDVDDEAAPTVTVAICTHNPDDSLLARVLGAACRHVDGRTVLEAIVVDNNCDPPLAERTAIGQFPVRVIEERVPGLTAARTAAIRHATGDVIVFVDDDNVLDGDYIAAVRTEFASNAHAGVVGGRILPEYEAPRPSWLGQFEGYLAVRRSEIRTVTTGPPWTEDFPVGAGMAVRREVAEQHVRETAEDEKIQGRRGSALSSGEDLDLDLFALSRGWQLVSLGHSGLTHVIPQARCTSRYLARLARANVVSSYALERKWAPVLGRSVFPLYAASLWTVLAKALLTRALGLVSRPMRIRAARNWGLLRIRAKSLGGGR